MKARTALTPITLKQPPVSDCWSDVENLRNQVRRHAYQLFEGRGRTDGHDLEDWFNAEMELLKPVLLEITEKDNVLLIHAELRDSKRMTVNFIWSLGS